MYGINELDAQGLKALIDKSEKIRLIDVRSVGEFQQGIIAGGELLPHTRQLKQLTI